MGGFIEQFGKAEGLAPRTPLRKRPFVEQGGNRCRVCGHGQVPKLGADEGTLTRGEA